MNETLIETPYETVYENVLDSSMWSLRQNGCVRHFYWQKAPLESESA
jgi:hypothetical protein